MADIQLRLEGEFKWTKEDDEFLQSLAPLVQKRIIEYARETGLNPRDAHSQLMMVEYGEAITERARNHAP